MIRVKGVSIHTYACGDSLCACELEGTVWCVWEERGGGGGVKEHFKNCMEWMRGEW